MRKRSLMLAACLAISLSAAGPARPQSPAPDAMAAARELLMTIKFIDQIKAVLPIIIQNLKPAIVQNRPQVEREFDAVMPLILEGMNPRLNEFPSKRRPSTPTNFTVAELRDITAFFRASTGEKVPAEDSRDRPAEHGGRTAIRTIGGRRDAWAHHRGAQQARAQKLRSAWDGRCRM